MQEAELVEVQVPKDRKTKMVIDLLAKYVAEVGLSFLLVVITVVRSLFFSGVLLRLRLFPDAFAAPAVCFCSLESLLLLFICYFSCRKAMSLSNKSLKNSPQKAVGFRV